MYIQRTDLCMILCIIMLCYNVYVYRVYILYIDVNETKTYTKKTRGNPGRKNRVNNEPFEIKSVCTSIN